MNKAIFLDRDGTINVDTRYTHKVEDFSFEKGALEGLKKLSNKGYKLIITTNQAGIGKGYYDKETYLKFSNHLKNELEKEGIKLDGIYHCPHHPTEGIGEFKQDCNCRKPNPGMILEACNEHNIDPAFSFMVGDKWSDIKAGNSAGCNSILLKTGDALGNMDKAVNDVIIKENLSEAADFILQSKVKTREELAQILVGLKAMGKKVVHTNGVYDIMHSGHLYLLKQAKAAGDILVVSINDDASVKGFKGPNRPILNQNERAELLAALDCVDFVTMYPEDDVKNTLKLLQPDVQVKGRGVIEERIKSERELVESWGGEMKIFSVVKGNSTSDIINKIQGEKNEQI